MPGSENIREKNGKKSDSFKTLLTPMAAKIKSTINIASKTAKNLMCFLIRANSFSSPNLFTIFEKRPLGYEG